MWLCERLTARTSPPGAPRTGCGLPIGNLTSQFWANVYLHELDEALARSGAVTGWARYMDDVVVGAQSKAECWEASEIAHDVASSLRLELKPRATQVTPTRDGVGWLGVRIWPGLIRLDRASKSRLTRKLARRTRAWAKAEGDERREQARAHTLCEHTRLADTLELRRALVENLCDARESQAHEGWA